MVGDFPASAAGAAETRWTPTIAEVSAAARSLYADEIKPYGRILMKRLREIAADSTDEVDVPLVDPESLRAVCEGSVEFIVECAEGREFAALLPSEKGCFVDACSPVDPYPPRLWEQAAAYLQALDEEAGRFPCGRYACAVELRARSAPFLVGRTLGEACHIVQLAISTRMLLGYAEGGLVPYARSEKCTKARNAVRHLPMVASKQYEAAALPYATWEDVRWGLPLILQRSRKPAPGVATISDIKRRFKSDLQLELSETALGHARILELLRDERLRDVCHVELASHGQAWVSSLGHGQAAPAPISDEAHCCSAHYAVPPPWRPSTARLSTCASTRCPVPIPQPFASAPASLPTPMYWPATTPTSPEFVHSGSAASSCNARSGKAGSETEATDSCETGSCAFSSDVGLAMCRSESSASAADLADIRAGRQRLWLGGQGQGFVVRNTFIDVAPAEVCGAWPLRFCAAGRLLNAQASRRKHQL